MPDSSLALLGGNPVCQQPWPETNTIGEEEKRAVQAVLESGVLSQFRGTAGPDFYGGPRVRQLESAWADYFNVRYAVSFNSLTSGLIAAIGAAGIGPGDEVIVPATSMVATATCVLMYGGIPIFADIQADSLCIDPANIRERITDRTKAIVVVHLFGHPADMDAIRMIAKEHNLRIIEDCAQAPAGKYKGQWVGTLGDIGGFSLNYHKTIHCGEGGVMITNDPHLAKQLQLIRNHGEAAVEAFGMASNINCFGGNTRMTEIEAAIAYCQLQKLEQLTMARTKLSRILDQGLAEIPGLQTQSQKHIGDRHVYYMYPMLFDVASWGISRDRFVEAVVAEGIELRQGYVRPIYWEPLYQNRSAFKNGFPFCLSDKPLDYAVGLCPVAEQLHQSSLVFGKFCRWPLTDQYAYAVIEAIRKVYQNRHLLRQSAVSAP